MYVSTHTKKNTKRASLSFWEIKFLNSQFFTATYGTMGSHFRTESQHHEGGVPLPPEVAYTRNTRVCYYAHRFPYCNFSAHLYAVGTRVLVDG